VRELIATLRGLFTAGAKARSRPSRPVAAGGVAPPPARRFADFPNPFRSAEAPDPAVAVRRTFEALDCWAAERGRPRTGDCTATEFAGQVMRQHPELGDGVRALAGTYAALTYADRRPEANELPRLAALWTLLERGQ
jgi:hypothetical protein